MDNLTLKQKLFVEKYLENNGNATEACAIAYGYTNRDVAGVCGHKLLRIAKIRAVLDNILAQAGISNETIVRSLKQKVDVGSFKGLKFAFKLIGFKNI